MPQFSRRFLERGAEAFPDLVDLGVGDDERRAEGDGIAGKRAHDEAVLAAQGFDHRADAQLRIKARFARLVLYQLERAEQADAAHVADERMRSETLQPCLEARRDL